MTTDDAKTYLSKRQIPNLFESLMTGLMYHRPGDHIKYLIDCLQKVHEKGQDNITWSSFVDIRRSKTPLPPIDKRRGSKGSRPNSRTRTPAKEESSPREVTASQPLPSIPTVEKVELPDEVPIVILMAAPGSDKDVHVEKLLKRYPGWAHVNMGSLIKEEIIRRGDAHSKWRMTKDLLSKGEAAPEDITIEALAEGLKKCSEAKGIVINGFPRSMVQVGDYDRVIGRIDCVFMLDCDEQQSLDRLLRRGKESGRPEDTLSSIAARLNYFKSHTLPAAKHYDDQGKLVVIDCDQGMERVEFDLGKAFDNLFLNKYGTQAIEGEAPPKSAELPPPPTYKGKYETEDSDLEEKPLFTGPVPQPPVIEVPDTGRKDDLPQCPIIFVAGGPGSGKGTQCGKLVQRYPDFVHLSMGDILRNEISTKGTADEKWGMISQLVSKGEMAPEEDTVELLKETLKKHMSAKAFLIEGFPRNKEQVEAFNKHIGGLNFVLLVDCEEYYMQNRLIKRGKESGRIDDNISAIAKRLHYYKNHTLPVMKCFDDMGKLVVLEGDRDIAETFFDISKLFDFAFFGEEPGEKPPELPEDEKLAADALRIQAAVKIQANYRGYMVRSGKWDTLRYKHKEAITDDDKLKLKERQTQKMPEVSLPIIQHGYQSSPTPTLETPRVTHSQEDQEAAATKTLAEIQGDKIKKEAETAGQKDQTESTDQTDMDKDHKETDQESEEAASRIQAGFRGFKARLEAKDRETEDKKDQEPVDQDLEDAVTRIQAGYRGYRARLEAQARENKKEQEPVDKDLEEAATRIQAAYRGYRARLEAQARKNKKEQSSEDIEGAASRIQAGYHGYKTRTQFLPQGERTKKEQEPSQETEAAATRIQAGYHGYKTRRQHYTQKEQEPSQETEAAATRIQAGYHGYKTRRQYHAQETKKPGSSEPVQEEVVEATITPQAGTTTGDDIANPSHTEKLDEIAKQEETSS